MTRDRARRLGERGETDKTDTQKDKKTFQRRVAVTNERRRFSYVFIVGPLRCAKSTYITPKCKPLSSPQYPKPSTHHRTLSLLHAERGAYFAAHQDYCFGVSPGQGNSCAITIFWRLRSTQSHRFAHWKLFRAPDA